MNDISISDVKKLALLSSIDLNDQEAEEMLTDLDQILGYVKQLQEVATDDVTPTYQVHSLETVTRDDEIIDYGVSQDALLQNAPKQQGGSIEVPRVLE